MLDPRGETQLQYRVKHVVRAVYTCLRELHITQLGSYQVQVGLRLIMPCDIMCFSDVGEQVTRHWRRGAPFCGENTGNG